MLTVPFHVPYRTGRETNAIQQCLSKSQISGDGSSTKECHKWFQSTYNIHQALLTTSCTHALEMSAELLDYQPGDEVIMPSFTFVSTANAFVKRGFKVIFADICPETLNIDPQSIIKLITSKTKAIVPVHYAGVSCDMGSILSIAEKHNLIVIEDAAQGIGASYKGKPLGSLGHLGALSFHDTKNISCGEGGALWINDQKFSERAEILREKGTNRSQFIRGHVDKYTWVDVGSSWLPSELNAAFLYDQLQDIENITKQRLSIHQHYQSRLIECSEKFNITLPSWPEETSPNAHLYYALLPTKESRNDFMDQMKNHGVGVTFHYIPLHSSPMGKKLNPYQKSLPITEDISSRLIRLPLYPDLSETDQDLVISSFKDVAQKIYGDSKT
ncbi:MAG: dTDP-4-amino-4,6-dideoxygalactose transaminase [Oligoflexales bacterium]